MRLRVIFSAVVGSVLLCLALAASASADIGGSGDDLRTGWYPDASALSPAVVSGGTFGQLWSAPVTGQVYAQPLYSNGTVIVATEENYIYGLDAATGAQQWSADLGQPWNPGDIGCGDISPWIGTTSTPVIDSSTNTVYLTYKTYVSGTSGPAAWYMDALDVTTGVQRPGFPIQLAGAAQNEPTTTFDATHQQQRPGLLLLDGVVYAAFGGHCDHKPYYGWVFGVSTAGQVTARWVDNPPGVYGAGIWTPGWGLMSNGDGSIFLVTGNGGAPSTPGLGDAPPTDLGEAVVHLAVQPDGTLQPVDYFAPFDALQLDNWDGDFGAGGIVGLPAAYFGTAAIPHLAVADGKEGYVYLLNLDNLGGYAQGTGGGDAVVQRLGPYGGVWGRAGVWPGDGGYVYITTAGNQLAAYKYGLTGSGQPALAHVGHTSDNFGWGSGPAVITSDGTTSGSAVVWAIWSSDRAGDGAQLRGYAPVPVGGTLPLLFSAAIGHSTNYSQVDEGGGRLYVGTRDGSVLAFGSPVAEQVTGASLTFPATVDGSSAQQTLTLTANTAVTIQSIASTSGQFAVGTPSQSLPAVLAAGQTLSVPVTFSPTGTGPIGGDVNVTLGDGTVAAFAVSGTGESSEPQLSVDQSLVSLGGTVIGGELTSSVTFSNVGNAPLTVSAVDPPSAPFGASGLPAVDDVINPGGSITVTLAFDPTAAGDFTSSLEIDSTGGNQIVNMSGSATTPGQLQLSSDTVDYGSVLVGDSVTKSFTLTNVGGGPVTITKSKPPFGGEFSAVTSLPEGTTIAPGDSVEEQVTFTPTATGDASGVWEINGDDGLGLRDVSFTGTGVQPQASVSVPAVQWTGTVVGGEGTSSVTFSNVGTAPLTVSAVDAPSAPFSASGLPAVDDVINPGGSITVTLAFDPTASGSFSGSLEIDSDGGNETVSLTGGAVSPGQLQASSGSVDFGSVLLGGTVTRSFKLTNVGGAPVTITKSAPPGGGEFAAGTTITEGSTIAPGDSVQETVSFTPTATGAASDAWGVNYDDGVSPQAAQVQFTGTGGEPQASVSSSQVSFGGTVLGGELTANVTFSNVGTGPLTVSAVHGPSAPFSATGLPAVDDVISAGDSMTVMVAFEPSAAGKFSGSLEIDSNGGDEVVGFNGSAVTPGQLQLSSGSLDFGSVLVGSAATQSFTLTNVGGAPVTVGAVDPPPAPFKASGLPAVDATIAPGDSIAVTLAFDPTAPGSFSGALEIDSDGGAEIIRATAAALPAVSLPPPRLSGLEFRPHALAKARLADGYITYEASAAGSTTLVLDRDLPGRLSGGRCVVRTPLNRSHTHCARYVVLTSFAHTDQQGVNSIQLLADVHRAALSPGYYRLSAQPTDDTSAGPLYVWFRVDRLARHAALRAPASTLVWRPSALWLIVSNDRVSA